MADRLNTSSEAEEILSSLRFETRLEKAVLARIAFAVSLVQNGKNVPESPNFSGGELKRPTFLALMSYLFDPYSLMCMGKEILPKTHFSPSASVEITHRYDGPYLMSMVLSFGAGQAYWKPFFLYRVSILSLKFLDFFFSLIFFNRKGSKCADF